MRRQLILRMLSGFYLILPTHALLTDFFRYGKPCLEMGILMQAAELDAHSDASPEDEAYGVATCCVSSW